MIFSSVCTWCISRCAVVAESRCLFFYLLMEGVGGSKQVSVGAAVSHSPSKNSSNNSSAHITEHSIKSMHDKQEHVHVEASIPSNNNSWLNTNEIENNNNNVHVKDAKSETIFNPSDILEKARAAIASADRATAAARAAASLVHTNFGSLKLEGESS
ncbi:IST1-like protein [Trifolium pratense]|uniref:IST1-like protein n=1 Tax=Trifolium pratense TaxID=57577 RepID=A0A2K3N395_TRIPR|nr:IST1-like protein [Trifolium pratense]